MSDNRNDTIRIAVIMAGGSGERFWPLSRRLRPKQLLNLSRPDQNMLQEGVARIAPLIPAERVFIATAPHLCEAIRDSGVGIPDENILAEPHKRNTAGCLAYVAARVIERFGDDAKNVTMAVLTADHLIPDQERFRSTVDTAMSAAERKKALCVIGVKPTRPEIGYGYIEIAEDMVQTSDVGDSNDSSHAVYRVLKFREKPDIESAEKFVATERFFWNSGMFFWTLPTFLDEIGNASPEHGAAVRDMSIAMKQGDEKRVAEIFDGLTNISIDYALMEKADNVVVVRADFEWDDIGSWDSLNRTLPCDENGNVVIGDPVLADTKNCIVYNEPGASKMAVAAVGVEDLAIIVSSDGVLVIPKNRAQEVRLATTILKEKGAKQL